MRIYYANGNYYEGLPHLAPKSGVQVIVEKVEGRTFQHSLGDYYGWDGKRWESSNTIKDYWEVTLHGKEIEAEKFKKIRGEAIAWLDKP